VSVVDVKLNDHFQFTLYLRVGPKLK